ncbi:MAG: TrkA family potassium uptake protein, partial [Candidatus Bathyarchaeota archaeon]
MVPKDRDQAAVIGLGDLGYNAALTIADGGITVLAIDKDQKIVNKIGNLQDPNIVALALDTTDTEALKESGIKEVDMVFITLSDLGESVYTIQNLLDLGIKEIIARASSDRNARILKKVGVADIVFPERETGNRVGNIIIASKGKTKVTDVIEFDSEIDYRVEEICVCEKIQGRTLRDLNFENRFQVKILFVKSVKKKKIEKNGEETEEEI